MKRLISCATKNPVRQFRSFFLLLFFYPVMLLSLSACGGSAGSEPQASDSDTGAILFSIRLNRNGDQPVTVENNHIIKALSSCAQEGVTQFQCSVYSASDTLLKTTSNLPCSSRRGAVDGIPAGENRKVVCKGWDADQNVVHLGQITGINVTAGKATDGGVLDFFPFSPTLTTPQDGATVAANAFSLNWESIIFARKYNVQVSDSPDFETLIIDELTTETTYMPTRLLPDTTYYWKIATLDFLGNPGRHSKVRSFTTLPGSRCRYPALTPIGNQSVAAGTTLTLDITAQDPDPDDSLTFRSSALPTGALLDPATGRFQWETMPGDEGHYHVVFKVCDACPEGPLCDIEEVTISVGDVCPPPVLEKIGPRQVQEGDLLRFTLHAASPASDAKLSFHAANLPKGSRFNPYTRTFLWKPHFWNAGNYQVNFKACNDCGGEPVCDSEQVTISVGEVCRPPELQRIGPQQTDVGTPLELRLKANDPDQSGGLTYSAGEEFDPFIDPDTGVFNWTPDSDDAGRHYTVRFQVCDTCPDGPLCDWEDVAITVGEGCRPPVLDPIGPLQGMEMGNPIEFTVSASDPDPESVLTYSAYDLPPWTDSDPLPQSYLWMPGWGAAGTYHATFEVCDDCASGPLCDSEEVEITMLPYCPGIEIDDSQIFQEVAVGELLEFVLRTNNHDVWNNIWIYEAYDVTGSDIAQYFDPQTHTFSWEPTADDAGSHQINFRVCDVCPAGQQCDDETFIIDVLENHLTQPALVEPADQVVLDNGCVDVQDPITWSFTWEAVEGADRYEISILQGDQPVITQIVSEPYYDLNCSEASQEIPQCHVFEGDLEGWTWQVRALSDDSRGGYYSLWSEVRNFNVNPLNCAETAD